MPEYDCPNIWGCRLVNDPEFPMGGKGRDHYIESYCRGFSSGFETCKRYIVRRSLFFCPDFILPDTSMSFDEILDKIETENH